MIECVQPIDIKDSGIQSYLVKSANLINYYYRKCYTISETTREDQETETQVVRTKYATFVDRKELEETCIIDSSPKEHLRSANPGCLGKFPSLCL